MINRGKQNDRDTAKIIDFSGTGIYNLIMPGLVKFFIPGVTDHVTHRGNRRLFFGNHDNTF